MKINSNTNNRIKAILTSSYIVSETVDLNVDQSSGYQLIEIPFSKINNISSDSFNLSFKNENNQSVSVDIADVYFMINNKTTLKFLGGSYSFNDVTNIEIYNNYFDQTPASIIDISGNNLFSIDDFLKSVNHLHNCFHLLFDGSHNPLYFNHGKTVGFYGFRFTLLVGSTTVFDSYLSTNSNLNSNDAWFLKTNSFNDIKCTKVYYRFNANDYEIITQETNSNDAVFIKAETKHYDYYNRLLSINHLHTNASGTFIITTSYEYFNNGELKKIYIKSGSETIILYHAEQNEQGFIYRKTIGKNSVDIDFANSYVEAIIKHNEVLGSEVVNTDYKKVLTYDAYQENLNGVAFSDDFDDYGSNEQNINLSNQEVTFTINNSNLYRLTQDVSNDTLTFKRYNGSSFDDVLSINKSIDLNQLTFFIDSSNSVIISQDIDIYGKILNEKLNNVNKVTYNYDSNGIESLTVLKNLTSVVDSYINKTTLFYFNGFDFYERSYFNNCFDIQRLYNGYTQYCFTSDEIYIIDADTYLIETQINNIHCDNHSLKLAYDAFNRLIRKERFSNNTSVLVDSFTYKNDSFLPATYKHTFFSNSHLASENYNYDFYGNLASINTLYQSNPYFSVSVTYTYDDFNRISTESNILVGSLSHSYSYYTDGRMERIDNNVLSYNDKGQLSSFGTISYSYDHYGNRLTKTVNNQTEYYTYERGKILHSLQ
ncbi:MAG: hypothetical protein J6Y42_00400, partial [Bacilli bacterium]|nr:hypothetical protein [Bacilli bacterium]